MPPLFKGEGFRLYVKVGEHPLYPWPHPSAGVIRNEDEAFVFLAAHEAAHFLYFTRQLRGDNTEPECHAFANKMLEAFRSDVPNPRPLFPKRPELPGILPDYDEHLFAIERDRAPARADIVQSAVTWFGPLPRPATP